MRIPNPKAVTTTEAYLAYKAEVLEQSELKDKLYHPYLHIDGWLAYWTGLTETYPTDKNGDPECLTDEEAYIAYLAGVTSEYPEALKDPADVRVASYLRYLISARFGRPDYPVTREELYLSMMKPAFIPSGDPSSEIELDGTVEAPFVDVKMYGDTFQQTYSGKNKLLVPRGTITNNGIVWTRSDGVMTGNGTTTSTFSTIVDNNTNVLPTPLPAGTYTFSRTVASKYVLEFVHRDSDNTLYNGVDYRIMPNETSKTFTVDHDIAKVGVALLRNTEESNLGTLTNVSFEAQLEAGSTATSYEPYVGGIPAPNPDYPQEIQTVTGRQVVGVRSKNLIDNNNLEYLATNANADTIFLSSLPTGIRWEYTGGGSPWLLFKVMDLNGYEGKTIRMSAKFDDNGRGYRIMRINEDGTGRNSEVISDTSGETLSYTVPNDLGERHFLGYRIEAKAQSVSNFTDLIMTVDEEDMEYAPYGADYEINLGKNLFDKNGEYIIGNGNPIVTQLDTGIKMEYNTSGSFPYAFWIIGKTSDFIGQTLTASADVTTSAPGLVPTIGIGLAKADGSSRATKSYISGAGSRKTSWTVAEDGEREYIFMSLYATNQGQYSQGDYTEYNNAQIEVGSTATPYAPYFEPIELCKIGDYQDYIYYDKGDWYLHKECGNRQLTTVTGTYSGAGSGYIGAYYNNTGMLPNSRTNGFSNRFSAQFSPFGSTAEAITYGTTGSDQVIITLNSSRMASSTVANWESWLANNETAVYYPLATPTDTQITNENLLAQLDALKEGGSYNDKTYIKVTATDPNLPGLLYVEAAV